MPVNKSRTKLQSDEQLIRGNDDTANLGRHALGLIHGHHNRQRTDAQAGDETTNGRLDPMRLGGNLDDGAKTGEEGRY